MAAASIRCAGSANVNLRHYHSTRYSQSTRSMRDQARSSECALHHIDGRRGDEVCYLNGASSLDTVSS